MRVTAASGALAVFFFVAAVVVGSMLYPGFSQIREPISALGAQDAPHAAILDFGGFLVRGIFVLIFAIGIAVNLRRSHQVVWIGSGLLTLYAVASIGAALLRCDPGCPVPENTHEGFLHLVTGLVAFSSIGLAPLALTPAFARCGRSKLAAYSAGSCILVLASFGAYAMFAVSPWAGLLERLATFFALSWLLVTAVSLMGDTFGVPGSRGRAGASSFG